MEYTRPATNLKKGLPLVLLTAVMNAGLLLFVKLASQTLPIATVAFFRFFITLIVIFPVIAIQFPETFRQHIKTQRIRLHLVRDLVGVSGLFCYFYAAKELDLADASILFNTVPLFIPLVVFFWRKVKILHRLWWGLGIGFAGVIIMLHPGEEVFQWASLVGLLSGILTAITITSVRLLSFSEPPTRTLFYFFLVGTIITFLIGVAHPEGFLTALTWHNLLFVLGVAACAYFYQFFMTTSTQYVPVRLSSAFMYLAVIFSLILDWLIWGRLPDSLGAVGIVLIIGGACLTLFLYPKDGPRKEAVKP